MKPYEYRMITLTLSLQLQHLPLGKSLFNMKMEEDTTWQEVMEIR